MEKCKLKVKDYFAHHITKFFVVVLRKFNSIDGEMQQALSFLTGGSINWTIFWQYGSRAFKYSQPLTLVILLLSICPKKIN